MGVRKPITLKYGAVRRLAKICQVSEKTVYSALRWESDTQLQELIRKRAKELGLIRRF